MLWYKIIDSNTQTVIQDGDENRFFISGLGTAISTLSIGSVDNNDFITYRCYDQNFDSVDVLLDEKGKKIFFLIFESAKKIMNFLLKNLNHNELFKNKKKLIFFSLIYSAFVLLRRLLM